MPEENVFECFYCSKGVGVNDKKASKYNKHFHLKCLRKLRTVAKRNYQGDVRLAINKHRGS